MARGIRIEETVLLVGAIGLTLWWLSSRNDAAPRGLGYTGWRQQWAKETGLDWKQYWGRPEGESRHDWRNDPNRKAWHNAREAMGYESGLPQGGGGGADGGWDHRAYSMYR